MFSDLFDSRLSKATADLLNCIIASKDLPEFFSALFFGIGKIIAYDHSVQWFSTVNNAGLEFYDAFKNSNLTMQLLVDSEGNKKAAQSFNDYYRYLQPPPDRFEKYGFAVDYRIWRNTQYYCDFIRTQGIRYSLVPVTLGLKHTFTIQREGGSGFTEQEALSAGLIAPLISRVYSCLERIEELEGGLFSEIDLGRFPCRFTPREAEIIKLVLLNFKSEEVAAFLCIGTRTVEKHIADVYEKLNIRSRYELFILGGVINLPEE